MATAKKAPVKKVTASKKTTSKKESTINAVKVRSFRVSPNSPAFKTFKLSRQTLYWVIIVSVIVFLQLWILALQAETIHYIEAEETAVHSSL